jgi:protein-export membrane protein SecD
LAILVGCGLHEPVGVVLVYEVDRDREPLAADVPLDRLLAAVRRRVRRVGEAELDEQGRIEVRVYGDDPTSIRNRLEHAGMLEFRIVADRRDHRHRDVIALAEEQEDQRREKGAEETGVSRPHLVLDEGTPAAQWVKVVEAEKDLFTTTPQFVCRNDAEGGAELLVMLDAYNVTGDYFTSVSAGVDRAGKPCINFAFDAAGARRFGKLTSSNLPDLERPDDHRCLAIILDRVVFSAPSIRSRIDERGEITGSFTQQEAEELAAVLNAGSLPAPLRLVEERPVAAPN